MTSQLQNEACALADGWIKKPLSWVGNSGDAETAEFWISEHGQIERDCPKYTEDLNLTHGLELKLTDEQHAFFRDVLWDNSGPRRIVVSASAGKRAEAILKALRLWEAPCPSPLPSTSEAINVVQRDYSSPQFDV